MRFLLPLVLSVLSPSALAGRENLLIEIQTDLCRAEADALHLCKATAEERNASCATEFENHERCYRLLPGMVQPALSSSGFSLDPGYSLDYTDVHPEHYVLRGTTCDTSQAFLDNLHASLASAGFPSRLWLGGPASGSCP
jgi:hypothetical protein